MANNLFNSREFHYDSELEKRFSKQTVLISDVKWLFLDIIEACFIKSRQDFTYKAACRKRSCDMNIVKLENLEKTYKSLKNCLDEVDNDCEILKNKVEYFKKLIDRQKQRVDSAKCLVENDCKLYNDLYNEDSPSPYFNKSKKYLSIKQEIIDLYKKKYLKLLDKHAKISRRFSTTKDPSFNKLSNFVDHYTKVICIIDQIGKNEQV